MLFEVIQFIGIRKLITKLPAGTAADQQSKVLGTSACILANATLVSHSSSCVVDKANRLRPLYL
jgi:hypothetical protein